MGDILKAIEFLGISGTISISLVVLFLFMQIVGEIIEVVGKTAPEVLKIRKYFARRRREKEQTAEALVKFNALLDDFYSHYNNDNITKRDNWMKTVDNRAVVCGHQMDEIKETLLQVTKALDVNTKMTEDMFVENSRDRIIDFAEKVVDPNYIVSHEQFRRIFRVYNDYEAWLEEHDRTNGEIDENYKIIQAAYVYRVNNHAFAEDLNKYISNNI